MFVIVFLITIVRVFKNIILSCFYRCFFISYRYANKSNIKVSNRLKSFDNKKEGQRLPLYF